MNSKQIFVSLIVTLLTTGAYAGGMGKGAGGGGGMGQGAGGGGMGQGAGMGMGQGAGGERLYQNLDADGDGYITREEVQAHQRRVERISNNWQKADANQDGRVDTSEFSAFEEQQRKEMQEGQ